MPGDPTPPVTPAPDAAIRERKTDRDNPQTPSVPRHPAPGSDPDLRRLLKWVFGALILTVLFAILVVEVTLRWFGP